jgi:phage tail P2-like protein
MATFLPNVSFTDLLSPALAGDPVAYAMAQALDAEMQDISRAIRTGLTLCNLEEQPDLVLDYLAVQFAVWGYSTTFPLDQKVSMIRNSVYWNSFKGTAGLMKSAITLIFANVTIIPWFQYDLTQPYHFRIACATPPTSDQIEVMNIYVNQLKSVRDYFEGFFETFFSTSSLFVGISEYTIIGSYIGPVPRGFPSI